VGALDVAAIHILEGAFDAGEVRQQRLYPAAPAYSSASPDHGTHSLRTGEPIPKGVTQQAHQPTCRQELADVDQCIFNSDPRRPSLAMSCPLEEVAMDPDASDSDGLGVGPDPDVHLLRFDAQPVQP